MKPDIVLALTGLTKSFGLIKAVNDVSLELKQGEILALLGENGAGKTTLMNMLFGHYLPDSGTIEVSSSAAKKKSLALGNPQAAIAAGIGMVHQHFTLAANLSGLDNIMLGSENLRGLRREKARAEQKIEKIFFLR